ncbi:MAG: discoidin domain-containing protein [Sedimentisphaerales bacterium]|nr:discoidin domain-containing protein [Sedimentisphaerales bacterium]
MCKKVICLICFIFVLSLAASASAELVVHYKLNETFGTTAADSSGNGYDGTINGSTNWVAGYLDGALELTGGCNITLPAAEMGLTSDIGSVAFWMNTDVPTAIYTIFWAGDNTTGGGFGAENEMHVHLESAGTYWRGGELSFFAIANPNTFLHTDPTKGAAGTAPVNPLLMGDQQWHHVAATWGDGSVKLYVDGVIISQSAYNSSSYQLSVIYLGQMANASRTYVGKLDDAQMYDHALTDADVDLAMKGGTPLGPATGPKPSDGDDDVSRDVVLSWTPGPFAATHNVYVGTVLDDVNNADASSSLLIGPGVDVNSFEPGRLEFGQEYFWRVDEVNAAPDNTIFTGPVWSFTVESRSIPISGTNIIATASSYAEGQEPENTINESGLVDDLHSLEVEGMWLTSDTDTGPIWIQYEFDKLYTLDEMIVWNYNGDSVLASLGFKDVTVEYSTDGTNWTQLGDPMVFPQAPGQNGYASDITVNFGGTAAKFVKINATSNWFPDYPLYGLSEVRFLYVPVSARQPSPDDGATGIAVNTTLSWRAGREAAEHKVYLSTDQQAVMDGTASATTVSQNSYSPSLELGSAYFWKVNEVNNAETTVEWEGDVWSFTTEEYLVVEDFEAYNDILEGEEGSNLVYLTWSDGYDNPAVNGSAIGYLTGNPMETDNVYDGNQSVPILYNNTSASSSVVSINPGVLPIGSNWSIGSPKALVLWIHGDPGNTGNDKLYVSVGNSRFPYEGDISRPQWKPMIVDLTGINLTNVSTLSISVERSGGSGSSGVVLIDEIRLYGTAPEITEEIWIEAETGTVTSPMMKYDDPNASGGQYVSTVSGTADQGAAPPYPNGTVTIPFEVKESGTYTARFRIAFPGTDDSCWVRIQGATVQPAVTPLANGWLHFNDIPTGDYWHWSQEVKNEGGAEPPVEFTMAAGTYNLEISYRGADLKFDAIAFSMIGTE